jgi:hypothetical protein
MSCLSILFPSLGFDNNAPRRRKTSFIGFVGQDLNRLITSPQLPPNSKINVLTQFSTLERCPINENSFNVVVDKDNVILLVRYDELNK